MLARWLLRPFREQKESVRAPFFRELSQQGFRSAFITDDENHRIYMRAVRDKVGEVIGYYERYEPPVKQVK